jgi:hypothetical protein
VRRRYRLVSAASNAKSVRLKDVPLRYVIACRTELERIAQPDVASRATISAGIKA